MAQVPDVVWRVDWKALVTFTVLRAGSPNITSFKDLQLAFARSLVGSEQQSWVSTAPCALPRVCWGRPRGFYYLSIYLFIFLSL